MICTFTYVPIFTTISYLHATSYNTANKIIRDYCSGDWFEKYRSANYSDISLVHYTDMH